MAGKVLRINTNILTSASRHGPAAVLAAAILAPAGGFAASMDTTLQLRLSETFSDNITLQDDESARSDFVTTIAPEIDIDFESQLVDLNLGYEYNALIYAKESTFNESYNRADALAGLNLIGETLRLMGDGSISQVNVDPQRPSDNTNIAVTGNRTDVYTWRVGPQWEQQISNSRVDAYYNVGKVYYDDPASQDVLTQRVGVRLFTDPESGSDTSYEIGYSGWDLDYEVSGDIKEQEAFVMLRQAIAGGGFEVYGLGGLDSDIADRSDSSLQEGRWEAGVEYRDADSHVSLGVGKRYFGTILRASAGREVTNWLFSLSYAEEPGTAETIGLREIPKVDEDAPSPPDAEIDELGTGKRFIRKRLDATAQWEGYASTWLFQVWWDQRDDVETGQITTDPNDPTVITDKSESVGVDVTYTWLLGQDTAVNFAGGWWERDFRDQLQDPGAGPSVTESTITSFLLSAGIDYLLGEQTAIGASARYYDVSSDRQSSTNFSEIRAMIYLNREF
jgi:hypothetical protein